MYLHKLKLVNYRNYSSLNGEFSSQVNLLIGMNAQGKTNLLEAMYYLATGRAYRPARDMQLVKWEGTFFKIFGEIANKIGKNKIEIGYRLDHQNPKEIKINGLKISKTGDLLGNITAVLFAPEDLYIIKGSPMERRKLIDNDISQVSPGYFMRLQRFNRILNQRNHLLKRIKDRKNGVGELNIWDQQYLEVSKEIIEKRLQVLEKITPLTRLMQRRLTDGTENLEIRYLLNREKEIKNGDNILNLLTKEAEKYKKEEIQKGVSLWGPHRDDLSFVLNANDLKYFGSQGQHRTSVLAVKLAELEFFRAETGEYPVLLLDDVMSELDHSRRDLLIKAIQDKGIQCFITTTEDLNGAWDKQISIKRYSINQGILTEMEGEG